MIEIMAHRPRTQKIGKDSQPREIAICKIKTLKEAKKILLQLQEAHLEQSKNGYPWNCKIVINGFIQEPNDNFYLKIDHG